MNVEWESTSDPLIYIHETLAKEADDIPLEEINKGFWYLDEINIHSISFDQNLVLEHDNNSFHIKRRDDFITTIKNGIKIKPLIVLGDDLFLVDGYARYRALKKLGINEVQVYRQKLK